MKTLLAALAVVALVVLVPRPAGANCEPGRLDLQRFWPADGVANVPTNTAVLMHGYGTDAYLARPVVVSLVPDHGAPVALHVVSDHRSGDRRMQQRTVVLQADAPLRPNTGYTIRSTGYVGSREPRFTTGVNADTSAPQASSITVTGFASIAMGCGPAHHVDLEVHGVQDDATPTAQVWVRLQVARTEALLRAGRFVAEVIEPLSHGRIQFGHEMCVGNYPLDPGQRFVARATVLDLARHEGTASGILVLDAR